MLALQATDGQFYWLHTDHLGSGRKLTNTSGAVVYRGEFDPHGQSLYEWHATGQTYLNSHKFTGYERDWATNLDHAKARTYHHNRGRFMQPDPLGLGAADATDPQSLNRYSYVQNDPVNFVDPSGLCIVISRYIGNDEFRLEFYLCNGGGGGGGGGSGGGFGGGGGGGGVSQNPAAPRQDNRSDCARFVDNLVEGNETARRQGIKGNYEKATFLAGHALLHAARQAAGNLGSGTFTGFQGRLTTRPQNDGVYQHVLAHAGATMIGNRPLLYPHSSDNTGGVTAYTGTELTNLALKQDEYQRDHPNERHTRPEAEAEIAGDHAGRIVGGLLMRGLSGELGSADLRQALFRELCQN